MSENLIDLVAPKPGSTILIYDVHASESGALAILNDLYYQIRDYRDKSVRWVFAVSTPEYEQTDNIVINRFPWVKKNWGYRYYFDNVTTRELLRKYKPDQVFSLQNKGIDFYHGPQMVYLHLPFILTDHRFYIKTDGKKLWLYQNVVSKSIFQSLRKVDKTIVQTHWMKDALIKKARVNADRIIIQQPDISNNGISSFEDTVENRRRLFYPATAFTYKNHMTLLKAMKYAQEQGLKDYELVLTIRPDENEYTRRLYSYAKENKLNVKFCGLISREEVFKMYTKSVLVFPSYVESFGLPLLEAKMTGCPIIAGDNPFCHEILDAYKDVVYFPATDEIELGRRIIGVVNR